MLYDKNEQARTVYMVDLRAGTDATYPDRWYRNGCQPVFFEFAQIFMRKYNAERAAKLHGGIVVGFKIRVDSWCSLTRPQV